MSIAAGVLTKNTSCVTDLATAADLEKWMQHVADDDTRASKSSGVGNLYMLYVYRPECPYCLAFQREISRLVAVLCFVFKKRMHVAQVAKSVVLQVPRLEQLAPTVPAVLSARAGGAWTRLPKDEINRTPSRLLQFLSDTWHERDLAPLESTPRFSTAKEIARAKYAYLVEYLPERDFPPCRLLKTKAGVAPAAASQQTHDLLLNFIESNQADDSRYALVNRLFLPADHRFHVDISPGREQRAPVLVDLASGAELASGQAIFKRENSKHFHSARDDSSDSDGSSDDSE